MITSTNPNTPLALIAWIRDVFEDEEMPNLNDKAVICITACIDEGVDTKAHIVRSLMRGGFDNGHAGSVLTGKVGRNHWRLGRDGRYHLNEPDAAAA